MVPRKLIALSLVTLLVLFAGTNQNVSSGRAQDGSQSPNAPLGTSITYQGTLTNANDNPINGSCNFRFSLYDAGTGGGQVGSILEKGPVSLVKGSFTVELDFGGAAFTGEARWLEVAVKCSGDADYTTLSPRQALTPAPYALSAASAPWSGLTGVPAGFADNIDNGTTYSAGNGLILDGTQFSVNFGGTGSAIIASRSDHNHYGQTWYGNGNGLTVQNNSKEGSSVIAYTTAITGTTYAISVTVASPNGTAGYFTNKSGSGTSRGWGVRSYTGNGSPGDAHPFGWYYRPAGEFAGPIGVIGAASTDATDGYGVLGISGAGNGVYGVSSGGPGVRGDSVFGAGVYGYSILGNAGHFQGNVNITGILSVGGSKSFRIDYPLDPVDKYLFHYSVESPQVQNLYNGTVTLDANGEAVVELPVYFSAVNAGPFQYQLTAIGAPGPNLYIAQEVTGNQFKIAGGAPGTKVSWLLLGMRNDPWIQDHPQTDVADKPEAEVGKYVYPQGYGQSESLQIGFQEQENQQP